MNRGDDVNSTGGPNVVDTILCLTVLESGLAAIHPFKNAMRPRSMNATTTGNRSPLWPVC